MMSFEDKPLVYILPPVAMKTTANEVGPEGGNNGLSSESVITFLEELQ